MWQQHTRCNYCALVRDKLGPTNKPTNRQGKDKAILGPAGHVILEWVEVYTDLIPYFLSLGYPYIHQFFNLVWLKPMPTTLGR